MYSYYKILVIANCCLWDSFPKTSEDENEWIWIITRIWTIERDWGVDAKKRVDFKNHFFGLVLTESVMNMTQKSVQLEIHNSVFKRDSYSMRRMPMPVALTNDVNFVTKWSLCFPIVKLVHWTFPAVIFLHNIHRLTATAAVCRYAQQILLYRKNGLFPSF